MEEQITKCQQYRVSPFPAPAHFKVGISLSAEEGRALISDASVPSAGAVGAYLERISTLARDGISPDALPAAMRLRCCLMSE